MHAEGIGHLRHKSTKGKARTNCSGVSFGFRPNFTPRFLAATRPVPVHSRISECSNSAMPANTVSTILLRHELGRRSRLELAGEKPTAVVAELAGNTSRAVHEYHLGVRAWAARLAHSGDVLLALLPSHAQAEARIALLIGNKDYKPGVGALANPLNDIRVVGEALKAVGFEVLNPAQNARRADMLVAIYEFAAKLKAAATCRGQPQKPITPSRAGGLKGNRQRRL